MVQGHAGTFSSAVAVSVAPALSSSAFSEVSCVVRPAADHLATASQFSEYPQASLYHACILPKPSPQVKTAAVQSENQSSTGDSRFWQPALWPH